MNINFLLLCLTPEKLFIYLQFGIYRYNFPENYIYFAHLFNKIKEIYEIFMICKNLIQQVF